MKILFVVPYTPNLIRVRSYNLILHLSDKGHQVTVLTLSSGPEDLTDAEGLANHCHQVISLPLSRWRSIWNCLAALPSGRPLQSVYSWEPALAGQLNHLVIGQNGRRPFDVVHVEHLRGVRYGVELNDRAEDTNSMPPVIWDSVDCISELFKQASANSRSTFGRWMTRLELGRTQKYEAWLLSQFSRILVTSPADRQALLDLVPIDDQVSQVNVLPNGVDLDYFKPDPAVVRDPATLVVSGKMSYHANITMALHLVQDIMPIVWAHRPEVKVLIVGKDPPRELQQLEDRPLINITGTVPEIRPYLQQATVSVVPMTYGVGIQNKVLEAMACATPVIVTPRVILGLEAVADQDLLVGLDPADFAKQILKLIANPDLRQSIGANGRAYVEEHHHWGRITGQLESIYRVAIRQPH